MNHPLTPSARLSRCFLEIVAWCDGPKEAVKAQSVDYQLAFHALAAFVGGEVAVKAVSADLVGAELEHDGLAGAGALGDAVLIDREAVRDVLCRKGDLHQIILLHFDTHWLEGELIAGNREFAGGRLRRGLAAERRDTRDEQAAGNDRDEDGAARNVDHGAPSFAGPRPAARHR